MCQESLFKHVAVCWLEREEKRAKHPPFCPQLIWYFPLCNTSWTNKCHKRRSDSTFSILPPVTQALEIISSRPQNITEVGKLCWNQDITKYFLSCLGFDGALHHCKAAEGARSSWTHVSLVYWESNQCTDKIRDNLTLIRVTVSAE